MGLFFRNESIKEIISPLIVSFFIHLTLLYLLFIFPIGTRWWHTESIEVSISNVALADLENKQKNGKGRETLVNYKGTGRSPFKKHLNSELANTKTNSQATEEQKKVTPSETEDIVRSDIQTGSISSAREFFNDGGGEISFPKEASIGHRINSTGKVKSGEKPYSSSFYSSNAPLSGNSQISRGGGVAGVIETDKDYGFIREAVLKSLIYPERARAMGIEGTVVVSFILTKNAKIKDIRVIKSSGSVILDNAAKEAVTKTNIGQTLLGELLIQLPITFRLNEHQ